MSHLHVAKLSALGQIVRVFSGPVVLLFIGINLSIDEKALYFAFFNIVALQQILELGVGYTSKQYISHSLDANNRLTHKTFDYINFSIVWFLAVSIFILIVIGFGGVWFFSSYNGSVLWQRPWLLLVLVSSISAAFIPIQISLEGVQEQRKVYLSKLIATTASTVVTVFCLNVGFGLYSPACGLFVNMMIQNLLIIRVFNKNVGFGSLYSSSKSFKFLTVLKEVFPLLSKVSITWLLGYALWNSFNLIAFKTLSIEHCALLGMTLALCRAGYSIADSIVSSQLTIFGNGISKGNAKEMDSLFKRYLLASVSILLIGYSFFLLLVFYFKAWAINEMILSFDYTILIMLFSFFILLVSTQNNFCRCFKVDPNFKNSLFLNISVPIFCYVGFHYYNEPNTLFPVIIAMISSIYSYYNYRRLVKS